MIVDRALVAAALPGYELGAQVGQGAFGMVLAAKNRLRRDVAVKVMPGISVRGERAENEALMLAEQDHPHVVKVYDFVPAGEMALIVMELLSGGSLRSRIDAGQSAPEWGCAAALAVASALEFAHGGGLLHRDVKPENVLFVFAADGRLKLTDFGIAKAFQDTAAFTSTVSGTPRYAARGPAPAPGRGRLAGGTRPAQRTRRAAGAGLDQTRGRLGGRRAAGPDRDGPAAGAVRGTCRPGAVLAVGRR